MPTTRYKPGDVLVTSFPFADSGVVKRRPVLCIASLAPKRGITLYWVLMITSTDLKGWKGDIVISDHKATGLPIPSIIRTAKIACIDGATIEKRVGVIDKATNKAVQSTVVRLFASQAG